jgi:hypothetical protein
VAEELASAIIELGLSATQSERLVSAFVRETGDTGVSDRLRLGSLSYIARVLDNYRYWDEQIALIPEEFRSPPSESRVVRESLRRNRMLDALATLLRSSGTGAPPSLCAELSHEVRQ